MMEGKMLSTERKTASIYSSLYLCSGFDSVREKNTSWRHSFHWKTWSFFCSCGKRGPRLRSLASCICISSDCNISEVSHCGTLSHLLVSESSKNCECSDLLLPDAYIPNPPELCLDQWAVLSGVFSRKCGRSFVSWDLLNWLHSI